MGRWSREGEAALLAAVDVSTAYELYPVGEEIVLAQDADHVLDVFRAEIPAPFLHETDDNSTLSRSAVEDPTPLPVAPATRLGQRELQVCED